MKQYTTAMAVIASLLVVVLIGFVFMQSDSDVTDDAVVTPTTKVIDTTPSPAVDDDDSVDQAVTVPNTDLEQTVTVGE
jgi:hypothetical protein